MHYFRPHRSVYLDFVHPFLQRSGTVEAVLTSSTLQSLGVALYLFVSVSANFHSLKLMLDFEIDLEFPRPASK